MPFAKIATLCALAALLSGCNDYLDNEDRMTPWSGEAQAANRVTHMVDPWPPYASDRKFSTYGPRVQRAMDKYKAGGSASTGTASSAGSTAEGKEDASTNVDKE